MRYVVKRKFHTYIVSSMPPVRSTGHPLVHIYTRNLQKCSKDRIRILTTWRQVLAVNEARQVDILTLRWRLVSPRFFNVALPDCV
jgi:hypothetical protein